MSWFTSLKEKSMKIAQLYKNELSDFMTNLNDEITGKNSDSPEETRSSQQSPEKARINIEPIAVSPSNMTIVHFLRPFLSKIVDNEELQAKITLVLSDPGGYLQDNITRLILPDRTDFTTFMEFQKYCTISNDDYEKIVGSDSELQKLLLDNNLEKSLESDSPLDRLQCFLYYIIYLFEDKPDKEPSFELPLSANPEQDIVFPRDDDGAIQNAGDALEKKTDLSDPYVVVEDGSSNSHGSNSNETERIESSGQRDVVSVSGSEDWQVEEKMFALEFNG